MRSVDADGHMRVEMSRISKANVCPYKGREIPNWEALGLEPDKIYKLFRDPVELAKSADSFTGKPLLMHHVPITADEPSKELWVGTVGKVSWSAPYLEARPLMVLTQEAIDAIESEEQRELSAAYRYEAQMVPGSYGGEAYDGRMVNIQGNHVCIVSEGRAGSDVLVADELPPEFRSMKKPKSAAGVAAKAIAPHLKGLSPAVRKAIALALDKELGEVPTAVGEKTGLDEDLTDEEKKSAEDSYRMDKGMDASEELSDEDKEFAYNKARDAKKAGDSAAANIDTPSGPKKGAGEDEDPDPMMDRRRGGDAAADPEDHRRDFRPGDRAHDSKRGITQDQLDAAVKAGVALARKQERDLAIAREAVRPVVGIVSMALDSADAVYAYALKHAGIDVVKDKIHPSAYPALLDVVKNSKPARGGTAPVAMDSNTRELANIDAIWKPKADSSATAH